MKYISIITFCLALLYLSSCSGSDNSTTPNNNNKPSYNLKINEFVASGSSLKSEFGHKEDWFEIYNPDDTIVHLNAFRWILADSKNNFILPSDTLIQPKGFLIIFCDDSNQVKTEIHTNFKLGADGDEINIFYRDQKNNVFTIDKYSWTESKSGISVGGYPDGTDNWMELAYPTPGSNNVK